MNALLDLPRATTDADWCPEPRCQGTADHVEYMEHYEQTRWSDGVVRTRYWS